MFNIDRCNKYGETPLMFASERGRADEVRRRIAEGEDLGAKYSEGESAREKADKTGHRDVASLRGGSRAPSAASARSSKARRSNESSPYTHRFGTARALAQFSKAVGWLIALAGLGVALVVALDGGRGNHFAGMGALSGVVAFLSGIAIVVCAQILHAVAYKADANRRNTGDHEGAGKPIAMSAEILMSALIVFLVRVYQRAAPVSLRRSCRFEPSCSHYMILAVEKYGAVMGVGKGINRLVRCRPPNGGVDYP